MELQVVNFLSSRREVPSSQGYRKAVCNFARLNFDTLENPEQNSAREKYQYRQRPMSARTPRPKVASPQKDETIYQITNKNLQPMKKKRVDDHVLERIIQERHAAMKEQENASQNGTNKKKTKQIIDRRNLPRETKASTKTHRVFYWGI